MNRKILKFFLFVLFLMVYLHPSKLSQSQGETIISLQPSAIKKQVGETFAVEIKLSAPEKILGVDIDLIYDPKILEVQKVNPADFFPNPQILTNETDAKNGTIKFSIFSYPIQQGNATIATILFKSIGQTTQSAQIQFAPSTTVATVGERKVPFKTSPASIDIITKAPTSIPSKFAPPTQNLTVSPFLTPTEIPLSPKSTASRSLVKPLGILLLLVGVGVLVFGFFVK